MSSKRSRGERLQDESPSKMPRAESSLRHSTLRAHVLGLNNQFVSWVAAQQVERPTELWVDGVKAYVDHVSSILSEFQEEIEAERKQNQTDGSTVTGHPSKVSLVSSEPAAATAGTPVTTISTFTSSLPSSAPAATFTPPEHRNNPGFGSNSFGGATSLFGSPLPTSNSATPSGAANAISLFGRPLPGLDSSPVVAEAATSASLIFGAVVPITSAADSPSSKSTGGANTTSKFGQPAAVTKTVSTPANGLVPAPFSFCGAAASASTVADGLVSSSGAAKPFSCTSLTSAPAMPVSNGLFSFGGASSAAAGAPTSTGLFGSGSTAPVATADNAGSTFSFAVVSGSGPSAAFGGAAATEERDGEEAPAQFDAAVGIDESAATVHFKSKGRLYNLVKAADATTGDWVNKGLGSIMLRQTKDMDKRSYMSFTTETGRVVFISSLNKAMKLQVGDAQPTVSFVANGKLDNENVTGQKLQFKFGKGKHTEFVTKFLELQNALPDPASA